MGNSRNGIIYVWSLVNFELKMRIGVDDCLGYRCLLSVDDLVRNFIKSCFFTTAWLNGFDFLAENQSKL